MGMRRLRIGMAQINTTVGDFPGNKGKILKAIDDARALGIDLLTFPELAICGYPPEDLLFKPQFVSETLKTLDEVVGNSSGITLIVGCVDAGEAIYNAAAVIHNGRLVDIYHKIFLPNYGVFDENRYFQAGENVPVYRIADIGIGINICEDIWYESGPTTAQAYAGAEVIINISASPYHTGKSDARLKMLSARAKDNVAIIAYNNLIGGQDELVFDGNSMILNEKGELIARGKQFEEDLVVADLDVEAVFQTRQYNPKWCKAPLLPNAERYQVARIAISDKAPGHDKPSLPPRRAQSMKGPGEIYSALVLGTQDYVRKNGFQKVVIGLSGGIDSSLVATIAVDALGASNVIGVAMPSPYSSTGSISDAKALAENIGIKLLTIPIDKTLTAYTETLAESFKGTKSDTTEENIQARIRGNILMALSNKFGWLVLTTGNKSEMATGYATLYGDMAGGYAVIKDVPKTTVYKLARYRNSISTLALIPISVIDKAPSAELRPDQKDTDSLPPYEQLDPVLTAYVEEDKNIEQIVNMGFNSQTVRKIARLVDTSEYKRRQAPPGIKITPRAFGRDRRLPITNRFKS